MAALSVFFPTPPLPVICVVGGGGIDPRSGVEVGWNGDTGAGDANAGETTVTTVGVRGFESRREGGGAAYG